MEIRRFGMGNRRPDGPPGSVGVTGQVIHTDGRVVISELAFTTKAALAAHSNANSGWFIVIEGGGFVAVGEERARIAAGEAVLWPAQVIHQAWTEGSHMRAIMVELPGDDEAPIQGLLEAGPGALAAGDVPVSRGEGSLAPHSGTQPVHDREAGEPL